MTEQTNATLGGTGTINGATTVQNGGTLAPGTNSIGKLTFGSSLVLAGSAVMEVSRNGGVPTNDLVFVTGTLTQGGALIVTNTGTNALTAGNSFKLFTAGTYAGSFTNLSLPALAGGLTWKTNTLASNGTIAVSNLLYTLTYTAGTNGTLGGSPTQTVAYGLSGTAVTAQPNLNYHFASWSDGLTANPRTEANVTNNLNVTANFVRLVTPVVTNLNLAVNRTSFTLAGTGGAGQNYVLLTATNLPPAAWTPVLTNTADTNGVFQLTDSQITNCPQRFYRVQAGQ